MNNIARYNARRRAAKRHTTKKYRVIFCANIIANVAQTETYNTYSAAQDAVERYRARGIDAFIE